VFGPRAIQDRWWIYQFVSYKDGRRPTFEEARFFVEQEVMEAESDRLLRQKLDELRARYEIEINEEAVTALELPAPRQTLDIRGGSADTEGEPSTP
jgi:hypothetical protein